ncbi:hypothetical protein Riv7116_3621 [Rivularia sp. PCC 7116]|uniref:hypothetical protein n=1 Tax=Rivularia sp. PCC 7116 TaxID=373994 RepID=UPI00029F4964|nr:hypothetical protein [Rivularia sp. PCC 7116]AFY56071.1 hypothetical protein Riv7116_3621 [Rivularia sp. PCC 7116]
MTGTLIQLKKQKSQLDESNDFAKRIGSSKRWQSLGRFKTIRRGYSIVQNHLQRSNPHFYQQKLNISNTSVISPPQLDECVDNIQETGVHLGLQLNSNAVEKIRSFAHLNPCTEPKHDGFFLASDIKNGCLQGKGRQVMRGLVSNLDKCATIDKIVRDGMLIEIARKYLGYYPTLITRHLTWSFASDLDEAETQKLYPPTNFHYDVAGLNFVTVSFFITDVEENTGPHIMIKKSHNRKPLKMLFRSNIQKEADVWRYYNRSEQLTITGNAGFGFFQDPSCIHRLKLPKNSNRLILQIRYS